MVAPDLIRTRPGSSTDSPSVSSTLYRVHLAVFSNGERAPFLVRDGSGVPEFWPTVFLARELRSQSFAANTLTKCLRSLQFLLTWASNEHIDILDRVDSGVFLDVHELDRLARAARLLISDVASAVTVFDPRQRRAGSLASVRVALPAQRRGTGPPSVFARLFYSERFLRWMGELRSATLLDEPHRRRAYDEALARFTKALQARIPDVPAGTSSRTSPPREIVRQMMEALHPAAPNNPWQDAAVRERNYLLVRYFLQFGARIGEILSLRVADVDVGRNELRFVRRPDAKQDPRRRQPTVKGHGGMVPLWDLGPPTERYLFTIRCRIRGAARQPYLFVSVKSGRAISDSQVRKLFTQLARAVGYERPFSPHVARHAWNEELSSIMDSLGLEEEHQEEIRIHLMRWSDNSTMAARYNRRFIERKAAEVLAALHASLFERRPLQ